MKYLSLFVFILALSACSSKPTPKEFACFNPFMPIQSVRVQTPSDAAVEQGDYVKVTDAMGNTALFPKSICVEVRNDPEAN